MHTRGFKSRTAAVVVAAVGVAGLAHTDAASAATDRNDAVVELARSVDPTRGLSASAGTATVSNSAIRSTIGQTHVTITAKDSRRARTFSDKSGASVYSVLENETQTAVFSSSLPPGATWHPNSDGSLSALVRTDRATLHLATVAPPFAVDSTGKRLPTRYKVSTDNTIEQLVDTREAKFPVAADPKLTYGWGVYLNAFGFEWNYLITRVKAESAVLYAGGCTFAKLPGWWSAILKAACFTIGAPSLVSILKSVVGSIRNPTLKSAQCYQTQLVPPNRKLSAVSWGNCK